MCGELNSSCLNRTLLIKFVKNEGMPKIYDYLGILIFFYSNEHEPIHVHGKYNEFESKAEFYIVNGRIVEIKIKSIDSAKPLTGSKCIDFKDFLEQYADRIVQKWIDYFVYHKDVEFEKINTRIK
jgi:hypothetical protein